MGPIDGFQTPTAGMAGPEWPRRAPNGRRQKKSAAWCRAFKWP